MKRLVLLFALSALAGCEATTQVYEKRGHKGVNINCSGLSSNWQQCYNQAAIACGQSGYKVIAKSGVGEEKDPADFVFGLNPAGFSSRNLIVLCE